MWISYENFGLILIWSNKTDNGWANMYCMYMFLQFYQTFTPQVLKEFYEDDSIIKDREMSRISGREALHSANGAYSTIDRNYNALLHQPTKELPDAELMENFKETFEKIFVDEKPDPIERYYLSGISLIQIAKTRVYDTLFSFSFANDTTREINYSASLKTEKLVKKILKHIGRLENFQAEEKQENNASVKIQMYEFFFSHILIKAMQVPFIEHTFMLGFFERNIRKRTTDDNPNKNKKRSYRKREYEYERRDRTMKLRQFYEFYSLLFDQTLFTPFSQFLSEESLKELQDILKNRIKKRKDIMKEGSIGMV